MQMSTRYGLTGIAGLALLTLGHQVRAAGGGGGSAGAFVLGVLPNFAAVVAITFVLLSIWSDQRRHADFSATKRVFIYCLAVSGAGLLAWEIFQKTSSRLVFDAHDIGATFVGLIAAGVAFNALTRTLRRQQKH